MADTLTTITTLINSPPGQLVAGGVLAGIVWKFFERVEAVLTDQTKFEIAVWLVGVKVGQKVEPWPDTFAKVFDRVFGMRHLSWRCFFRSCVASYAVSAVALAPLYLPGFRDRNFTVGTETSAADLLIVVLILNVLPDYISLLETRFVLSKMLNAPSSLLIAFISLDFVVTAGIAFLTTMLVFPIGTVVGTVHHYFGDLRELLSPDVLRGVGQDMRLALDWKFNNFFKSQLRVWFYPAFFTSIWLWLYAGSGFLLKAARRFDIGFRWFNAKFDIEKKPLQSIGLVAGALVAIVYWLAVIVSKLVHHG